MTGYDEWKTTIPADSREYQAEMARYAAEAAADQPPPRYKLTLWHEPTLRCSCARLSVHYPGDRGWITLNESIVCGDDMSGALRTMRAGRRLV
jgi:hypothetical protein